MSGKVRAVWMRGGTSKGLFFHAADLPADPHDRDAMILRVMGSPDPYGRQLDGMGGGISSLSKVAIIARSARPDADIDYTFIQVSVDRPAVDLTSTCGNLTAAVGPFAVEEGLVAAPEGPAVVRIFNTNSGQRIEARFEVRDGLPVETGETRMAGVSFGGAAIELRFLEPAASSTSAFLPAGAATIDIGGRPVSLVDASAFCVFAHAGDFGLTGLESPEALEQSGEVLAALESLRRAAAVRVGLASKAADAPAATPRVAIVAAPRDFVAGDGSHIPAEAYDVSVRMISMGRPHRAVPATGAMCLAAAANMPGSVPHQALGPSRAGVVRVGHPGGITEVSAEVTQGPDGLQVAWTGLVRTARRLMEGAVVLPRS